MIFNHPIPEAYPKSIVSLNDEAVENVTVFRYLGSDIKHDEESTGDEEINLRIDCAEGKFYQLGKKFMIALSNRIPLLNALVRSRLKYGCQTWALTAQQKERLSSSYISMLRKMIRAGYKRKTDTWRFVYSNEQLLELCHVESIDGFVHRMQRSYLAHIIRKNDDSIAKRLLFSSKRSRRPGRYISTMKSVLQREDCTMTQFVKKAANKEY